MLHEGVALAFALDGLEGHAHHEHATFAWFGEHGGVASALAEDEHGNGLHALGGVQHVGIFYYVDVLAEGIVVVEVAALE